MVSTALISLRETLETSLIVGVMLAVLEAMGKRRLSLWVWLGVGAGIVGSIVLALLLQLLSSSLQGTVREAYEGVVMITAAGLLSWMVYWMWRNSKTFTTRVREEAGTAARTGEVLALFLLSFTSTMREGAEMALFLHAALLSSGASAQAVAGIFLGIGVAVLIAYVLFRNFFRFPLKHVMRGTSILLLLLAISLVIRGVEEIAEAVLG